MFKKFIKDEAGATAIEYALIAAAMALMLVVSMPAIATIMGVQFGNIAGHIATGK